MIGVSDAVGMPAQAADGIDPAFQSARVSQKFGADLSAAAGRNVRSGDADLPVKAPLHERRARLDTVSPRLGPCIRSFTSTFASCDVTMNVFLGILWERHQHNTERHVTM